jgi:hypothetical protein
MATKKIDAHTETALIVVRDTVESASTHEVHTLYGRLRHLAGVVAAATDVVKTELFDRVLGHAQRTFVPTDEEPEFDPDARTWEWTNTEFGGSVARQYRSGRLESINHGAIEALLTREGIPLEKAGYRRFIFDERKVIALLEEKGLDLADFGVWDFEADAKKIEKLVEADMLPVDEVAEACRFKAPTFAIQVTDNEVVKEAISSGTLVSGWTERLMLEG